MTYTRLEELGLEAFGFQARRTIQLFQGSGVPRPELESNYYHSAVICYSQSSLIAVIQDKLRIIPISLLSTKLEPDQEEDSDEPITLADSDVKEITLDSNIQQIYLTADESYAVLIFDQSKKICSIQTSQLFGQWDGTVSSLTSYNLGSCIVDVSLSSLKPDLVAIVTESNFLTIANVREINKASTIRKDVTCSFWKDDLPDALYVGSKTTAEISIIKVNGEESLKISNEDDETKESELHAMKFFAIDADSMLVIYGSSRASEGNNDFKSFVLKNDEIANEAVDICQPWGSIPRKASFYGVNLSGWCKEFPSVLFTIGSKSIELNATTPESQIRELNDSDNAEMPLDEDTGDDDTSLGLVIDLQASKNVNQPCKLLDSSGPLPRIIVLSNRGQLLTWNIWYTDAIRAKEDNLSQALRNAVAKSGASSAEKASEVKEAPTVSKVSEKQELVPSNKTMLQPRESETSNIAPSQPQAPANTENSIFSNSTAENPFGLSDATSFSSAQMKTLGFGNQYSQAATGKMFSVKQSNAFTSNSSKTQEDPFGSLAKETNSSGLFKGGSGFKMSGNTENTPGLFGSFNTGDNKLFNANIGTKQSGFAAFGASHSQESPFAALMQENDNKTENKFSDFKATGGFKFGSSSAQRPNNEHYIEELDSSSSVEELESQSEPSEEMGESPSEKLKEADNSIEEITASNAVSDKVKDDSSVDNLLGNAAKNLTISGDGEEKESVQKEREEELEKAKKEKEAAQANAEKERKMAQEKAEKERKRKEEEIRNRIEKEREIAQEERERAREKAEKEREKAEEERKKKEEKSKRIKKQEIETVVKDGAKPEAEERKNVEKDDKTEETKSVGKKDEAVIPKHEPTHPNKDNDILSSKYASKEEKKEDETFEEINKEDVEKSMAEETSNDKKTEDKTSKDEEAEQANPEAEEKSAEGKEQFVKDQNTADEDTERANAETEKKSEVGKDKNTVNEDKEEASVSKKIDVKPSKLVDVGVYTEALEAKSVDAEKVEYKDEQISVGEGLLDFKVQSFEDEEVYLSKLNVPPPVPEMRVLGTVIYPEMSAHPVTSEMMKIVYDTDADMVMLQKNIESMNMFLSKHMDDRIKHTLEKSISFQGFWRLDEANTVSDGINATYSRYEKALTESKDTEKRSSKLVDEIMSVYRMLPQLKALLESGAEPPLLSRKGELPFESLQKRKKINDLVSKVKKQDSELMSQMLLMNAISNPKWLTNNTNGVESVLAGIDYRIRSETSNLLELQKELNGQNPKEEKESSLRDNSSENWVSQEKQIEASSIISQLSNKQRLKKILGRRRTNPQRIAL
ncbi:hypothetical protein HII12_002761 [Brettanomyces bruxellensis]|uniref:Nucleoporin Nup159/Nup146 N-terminal domain-containing protein n=1 Tax=Dekkera bruxellensis TaxID=5007 RepID=A0A8H6EV21_DEKBR|nr:hypothetical protein HII12_002761 [Brettanomyces bruxellensis]